jgi:hypothetical protein
MEGMTGKAAALIAREVLENLPLVMSEGLGNGSRGRDGQIFGEIVLHEQARDRIVRELQSPRQSIKVNSIIVFSAFVSGEASFDCPLT